MLCVYFVYMLYIFSAQVKHTAQSNYVVINFVVILSPSPASSHRCKASIDFSLQTVWLLEAYTNSSGVPSRKLTRGSKLKKAILSEELRLGKNKLKQNNEVAVPFPVTSPMKRTHLRSRSDATGGKPLKTISLK